MSIDVVYIFDKCIILLLINKEIVMAFFEYFDFVLFEHYYIDSTCSFKGFVIIVEIIMNFNSKYQTAEKESMYVDPIESEILIFNYVPIHDNYGQYETFWGKASQSMNPS